MPDNPTSRTETGGVSMGIVEACWLAAALLLPLFSDPYTLGFQAPKAFLLRTLGILAFSGWLLGVFSRLVSSGKFGAGPKPWGWFPAFATIAAMLTATGIANIFSVNPITSFFGSPEMTMGSLTSASGLVLLCLTASGLRRWEQVERLITVLIAASLPVSLYALMQTANLDPLVFEANEGRVHSFVGHPIFLAGYLVMVIPLTLFRMVADRAGSLPGGGATFSGRASFAFHCMLLGLQCAAFLCTKSRGPLVALIVVICCLAVGVAVRFQRRRLLLGAVVFGLAAVAALAALGVASRSGAKWATDSALARFSSILPMGAGPDGFRASLWKSAPRMILGSEPLSFPNGGSDRWHGWRAVLGYGPETLGEVLPQFWTVPNAGGRQENRFHSYVWDKWASEGALGLAAMLGFVLVVFRLGFGTLGFIRKPGGAICFYTLALGGAGVGIAVACAVGGGAYASLGSVMGLVAGLWTHPLLSFRKSTATAPRHAFAGRRQILMIALLAALTGHLVETAFAFEVVTTYAIFLILAAMVIALALSFQERAASETPSPGLTEEPQPSEGGALASGGRVFPQPAISWLLVSLVLVVLVFNFLHGYFHQPVSFWGFLSQALTGLQGDRGASHLIPLMLVPAWLGTSFLLASSRAGWSWRKVFAGICIPSIAIAGIHCLIQGAILASAGSLPNAADAPAVSLEKCMIYETASVFSLLLILGLVIGLGVACARPGALKECTPRQLLAGVVAGTGALWLCWFVAFMPLRAEVAEAWGVALRSFGKSQHVAGNLRRAVMLNPQPSLYHRQLAWTLADLSESSAPDARQGLASETEAILTSVVERSRGLDVAIYQLAQFYFRLAVIEGEPEAKAVLARQAAEAFDRSAIYQPGQGGLWFESALNDRLHLGREADAVRKMAQARAITAEHDPADWGNRLRQMMAAARSPEVAAQYATLALEYYDRAIARGSTSQADPTSSHFGRGVIRAAMNDNDGALPDLLLVLAGSPIPERWEAEVMVAQIYAGRGNTADAQRHLVNAIRDAPGVAREELLQLHRQLFGRAP